jgi:hypothetical protein
VELRRVAQEVADARADLLDRRTALARSAYAECSRRRMPLAAPSVAGAASLDEPATLRCVGRPGEPGSIGGARPSRLRAPGVCTAAASPRAGAATARPAAPRRAAGGAAGASVTELKPVRRRKPRPADTPPDDGTPAGASRGVPGGAWGAKPRAAGPAPRRHPLCGGC